MVGPAGSLGTKLIGAGARFVRLAAESIRLVWLALSDPSLMFTWDQLGPLLSVSAAVMPVRRPPLPTFTMSLVMPPALMIVGPLVARTLTVSLPLPVFTVVVQLTSVLLIW